MKQADNMNTIFVVSVLICVYIAVTVTSQPAISFTTDYIEDYLSASARDFTPQQPLKRPLRTIRSDQKNRKEAPNKQVSYNASIKQYRRIDEKRNSAIKTTDSEDQWTNEVKKLHKRMGDGSATYNISIPMVRRNMQHEQRSRRVRNTEWNQQLIPGENKILPAHIIFRHNTRPITANFQQDAPSIHINTPDTLSSGHSVEESTYIYLHPENKSPEISDQTSPTQSHSSIDNIWSNRDSQSNNYANFQSSEQVRIDNVPRSTEMSTGYVSTYNPHDARVINNRYTPVNLQDNNHLGVNSNGQRNSQNQYDFLQSYEDVARATSKFQERSDRGATSGYHRHHETYHSTPLPPGLTNSHPALIEMLSTAGADKLMAELRSLRHQNTDTETAESDDKDECDCGAPASTGTVVGLTGLAALLIYALSIQTITSKTSAGGRSLMPDSHGYMESFMPALISAHNTQRPQPFAGISWDTYSRWKSRPAQTTLPPSSSVLQSVPAGPADRRRSQAVTNRRSSARRHQPPASSLVSRVQRWIQGRGRRVYRPANGTSTKDTSSSEDRCQCGLQQMLDMLSYVPLAVLLGYSTTISTTALTTGSNSAGSSSGGATNIGVTINDADVITNDNSNAPTLTNTDSDVLSVVAQGSPVNTNTNTASNQDSDMISNSIIGGRRKKRSTQSGPWWTRGQPANSFIKIYRQPLVDNESIT